MAKKGAKSLRGVGETDWGEPKTARLSADMTPTGREALKALAEKLEISVAEMLERLARNQLDAGPAQDFIKALVEKRKPALLDIQKLADRLGLPAENLAALVKECCCETEEKARGKSHS